MAGYVGTKAVLLSTTAANVGGDADIGGALDVGGAFTSQGIDDNATSTAMTLDASGNVGIGTDSPSAKFESRTVDNAQAAISAYETTIGGEAKIDLKVRNNSSAPITMGRVSSDMSSGSAGAEAGDLRFSTTSGGTLAERMRITSSGDVGIGTSSPIGSLDVSRSGSHEVVFRSTTGDPTINLQADGQNNGKISYVRATEGLTFSNSGSERMRIDSAGVLIVGNTSSNSQPGTVDAKGYKGNAGVGGAKGNAFNVYWTGSSPQLWIDTTNVGTISVSSDYRIKRNVETQTDEALSRVMQLRPVTYQMADYEDLFNASDDIKEGFIAHEVSEIIPSAVEGEKDCSDQIQSLKLDAIVSVLTKALQEQQVLIETLRADLAALQEAPDEITDLKARVATLEAN